MAEFEEGTILLEGSNSKASLAPEMEFIHSQLMRKVDDGDHIINGHAYDHDHDHAMAPFSGAHHHMIPTDHQMSLYQSEHHRDRILGFGGAKDKSSSQHLFNFSSPSASQTGLAIGNNNNKMNLGGKKRKRNNNVNVEKPKEVVHVRAKRGQATDSHSLAERVRREKINERLRNLQDLVPGCYKTMGMAVMLDVIINYVRSLQNQIEFLSMKLSAASMYNDLNFLEMAVNTMQSTDHQGTEGYEAWAKW